MAVAARKRAPAKADQEVNARHKCEKHGLNLCNRMLNGRTCKNDDCWAKSKLCHAPDCCANKSRARQAPGERHAAKAAARQAKVELDNLDPASVATRVNEDR